MKNTNHPFFDFCQDMTSLCQPLNQIGIDYLSYTRVYNNGERVYLVSEPIVMEYYFASQNYLTCGNEKHPDNYQPNQVMVWSTLPNQPVYQDAKQMGAGHGIYLFGDKQDDYCESFGFASSTHDDIILNSYFNHLDLLKKFTSYFSNEASMLLKQADKHKIALPFNNGKMTLPFNSQELERFLKKHNSPKLTPRQWECVHLLMKGLPSKVIAKELNLSPRTVESHLDDIKYKLQCKNKNQLVIKLARILEKLPVNH